MRYETIAHRQGQRADDIFAVPHRPAAGEEGGDGRRDAESRRLCDGPADAGGSWVLVQGKWLLDIWREEVLTVLVVVRSCHVLLYRLYTHLVVLVRGPGPWHNFFIHLFRRRWRLAYCES